MQGTAGSDYPEDRSPVDVLAASRGDALMCFVEQIADDELVVTIGRDRGGQPVRLQHGERVELVWKDAGELRSLPAELTGAETAPEEVWRLRPVGPATRGQRRAAVRAPMPFRAVLEYGAVTAEGTTVDVSEGGVRASFAHAGRARAARVSDLREAAADESHAPEVGSVVNLTVWFDERQHVSAKAEVIREHHHDDLKTELSLRFIGLPEKMQDLVRYEVFAGLRKMRARGLI
jgi:hypothetical protein